MTHIINLLSRRRRRVLLFCLTLVLVAAAGLTVAGLRTDSSDAGAERNGRHRHRARLGFPGRATFNIRMGVFGSRGADGTVVGTTTVNADGTVAYSVEVPEELSGHRRIAIRLDGYQNYYSYALVLEPSACHRYRAVPRRRKRRVRGAFPATPATRPLTSPRLMLRPTPSPSTGIISHPIRPSPFVSTVWGRGE